MPSGGWFPRWTEEEDQILIDVYGKISYEDVYKLLPHRNSSGIRQRAGKLGLGLSASEAAKLAPTAHFAAEANRGSAPLNHSYFSSLDERRAYWLGFIFADGYLDHRKKAIRIAIVEKDRELLDSFAQDIELPASYVKTRDRRGIGRQNQVDVSAQSPKMYSDVLYYGIVEMKHNGLSKPNIEDELLLDFIVGLTDGDGYIDQKQIVIATTTPVAEWLVSLLGGSIYKYKHTNKAVRYRGNRQTLNKLQKFVSTRNYQPLRRKWCVSE